ncbi:MAG: Thiamine pyrophosphate-dependent dehydrogenase E1 component beta subunit [Caldanaerobacter subterraneus]|jgi:pyruvate dehydrogenase E1 component beta subunit|uniref:Thiamine pyrophosphate-dependent dehydrogenases, E1 component beta subunit n=3 Tax=Caldanaerobacter subterraneus TaxID=911092 RepID=Q8RD60_CALS4|nr:MULTISPECIES: alpha-ketoacid dehydrogenase subunit beta [Caldanaerobacter]AAM23488.1 Thiamine pyrophosphate-dependent dehydrogenases, E1 component beta subunit [Caldanaerobacter subterraneus subsp. tengcongensis MB4]ERM92631.1 TPP-dependent acetoin dehydrogenase complex, E1 protein subunit beta [Caldanaerobacter subterraneus subsp. yonseiensis KB-1]KUK07801.1 MAG: Thiamine pyrophosphate-dependent dehydrogenase E1 component beta subunit [Caldanaerobacter subterraneus]MCS3917032.1 pyruvate deh
MAEKLYIEALAEAIKEEFERDPNVFMMGEDIGIYGGAFGVTKGMYPKYKDKLIETPISEASIVGAGVGAALVGMRPIVEIMFSDFMMDAMEWIVNQAAKLRYMTGGQLKVPLVIRSPMGSGTGAAAQHSQSLPAMFAHIPGLKVVMPATPYDVKGLFKAAVRDDNPVIFFEHKLLYWTKGEVPEGDYIVPIGKADVKREGKDITIIAGSITVIRSLEAAEKLKGEGIDVEVIDVRSLSPLDTETIVNSVIKTGKVLIVEDDNKSYGWGAEVLSRIVESDAFDYLDYPIQRLGGKDVPIPYNPKLERAAVPQVEDIIEAVKAIFGKE